MTTTTQYGAFLFPHNPAVITLEKPGRHARFFCPGHGEIVQALGDGAREITLKGSFSCHSAAAAAALLADFEEKTAGITPRVLSLPGRNPVYAVLCDHSFEASGDGRVLPYTMRFVEIDPSLSGGV